MSNVEYRCPICGSRLFAEPDMPIYKCRTHTDTIMEQAEVFAGPNFQYKEEGEVNPRKTGILTEGAFDETGRSAITPVITKPVPKTLSPEEELKQLREMWERVFEEPADKRYGPARLRKEIEQAEEDAAKALEVVEQEALLDNTEDSE